MTDNLQQLILNSSEAKVVDPDCLCEMLPSLCPGNPSSVREEFDTSPVCSQSPTLKSEARGSIEIGMDEPPSSSTILDPQNTSTSIQEIMAYK